MHAGINQIRDLRSQLEMIEKRFEEDPKSKAIRDAAQELERKLSPIEENLIQVNMKGSEANLAFPNMLNEEFDTFAAFVEAGDGAPTQQQYQVFKMLSGRLEDQLGKLDRILSTDLPAFTELVKRSNVPLLYLPKPRP